jgi:hypothetical protein
MRPSVVKRDHLDVEVVVMPVLVDVFDAGIGEADVVLIARQGVLVCPVTDLPLAPIGTAVAVRAPPVVLLEKALIVALQLVIEDDPIDASAALAEALGLPEVRAVHLQVMFDFARLLQIGVELLLGPGSALPSRVAGVVVATVGLEEVPPALGEDDSDVAMPVDVNGTRQALLLEMPKVASVGIERAVVVIAKVTRGHDAERADGCQRTRLGTAQADITIAVPHQLALEAAREVYFVQKGVAGIG